MKGAIGMRACLCHPSLCLSLALALLCGCRGGQTTRTHPVQVGGSPDRGKAVIVEHSCGKCHTIPGIHNANGVVGPPLTFIARRSMIAGNFPNTPENLIHWVMDPKSMKPKTDMPNLGLTEPQARDVVAYLETLR
jgi:cytochrome c1